MTVYSSELFPTVDDSRLLRIFQVMSVYSNGQARPPQGFEELV